MAVAVPLRSDFDAAQLRALAKRARDPDQTRRLLALAAIYDGASRTEAAQIGCVTLQIVRDWVLRFNARGPEGLRTGRALGAPPRLTDAHRAALVARVDAGPIPAIHGVVRWRLIDLIQWLWEEFRLSISKQTLSRELRAMNYRKLSARPRHHAKNEAAVAAFKKTSRPVWRRSGRRSAASRSRSGSPMRRGSGRRTRSRGAGLNAPRALQLRKTKGQRRPTSSARSARLTAGRWPGAAALHDRGDDVAPEGDRAGGCTRRACPCLGGPGGLASVEEACGPRQHPPPAAPGQGAGVEPGREHLAVHARELDLEPDLRLLRRHPRPLLRSVEKAHRSALAHHFHRTA